MPLRLTEPVSVLRRVGEEVVGEDVVTDLIQRRTHHVSAGLLGVAVHLEVRPHYLRGEQSRDGQHLGRAVLDVVLHAVGIAGGSLKAHDGAAAHGVSRAAASLDVSLVITRGCEDVSHSAVLAAQRSHGVGEGQRGAVGGDANHGFDHAVGADGAAHSQSHIIQGGISGSGGHVQPCGVGDHHYQTVSGASGDLAVVHGAGGIEARNVAAVADQVVGSGVEELRLDDTLGEDLFGIEGVSHVSFHSL